MTPAPQDLTALLAWVKEKAETARRRHSSYGHGGGSLWRAEAETHQAEADQFDAIAARLEKAEEVYQLARKLSVVLWDNTNWSDDARHWCATQSEFVDELNALDLALPAPPATSESK